MDTPPPADLDEKDLAGALGSSWGLVVDRLRYIPKGFGSYHWLAETPAGQRYFVTVDDLDTKPWLGGDRESTFEGLRAAYETAVILHEEADLGLVVPPVPELEGASAVRLTPRYSLAYSHSSRAQPAIGANRSARRSAIDWPGCSPSYTCPLRSWHPERPGVAWSCPGAPSWKRPSWTSTDRGRVGPSLSGQGASWRPMPIRCMNGLHHLTISQAGWPTRRLSRSSLMASHIRAI